MSFRVQAPPPNAPAPSAGEAKAKEDAAKVGRDFEAILVRQMLSSTKVAGKGGGYADMAIESLASSISAAGGLGMGRAIEQAIAAAQHGAASAPHVAPTTPGSETKKVNAGPQVPPGPAVRDSGE
ncbi:MAG: hypothetical protein KIS78_12250 [Labilithrix sp.]|nr:hypothetical protein [Labilithrix sp.]MCW5833164.1 hypothetical protein [Labilithrix sp.]